MLKQLRTFLAFDLPEDIKKSAIKLQEHLKIFYPDDEMYYPPPESFHATLLYIGEMDKNKLSDVRLAIDSCVSSIEKTSAYIKNMGTFLQKNKNPRVIFMDIHEPTDKLSPMVSNIKHSLHPLGFKFPSNKLKLHLTLCKVAYGHSPKYIFNFRDVVAESPFKYFLPFEDIKIKSISLYHSVPNIETSIYEKLCEFELKP